MGTKVQSKSYLPGYHSMRDLKDDANTGTWSLFYNRMLTNGQYCNSFTLRPRDGYSDYDKEILKQTMLQHEDIFRKQVYELHRLYGVQKDLMNEVRKKELYKYPITSVTLQSNTYSSHMPFENNHKTWEMSILPTMTSPCGGPSMSTTENRSSLLNYLKEIDKPLSPILNQKGSVKDCKILESEHKKLPRKSFDLQLPADEYIDSDDEENQETRIGEVSLASKYTPGRNILVQPTDMRLASWTQDEGTLGLQLREKTIYLADLNEPVLMDNEEAEDSASVKFLSPVVQYKQILEKQPSGNPGIPNDFIQEHNFGRDNAECSSSLRAENEKNKSEWQPYNLELGKGTTSFTPIFGPEKSTPSSEPIEIGLRKAVEVPTFLLPDQSKRDSWFTPKSTSSMELSNTSSIATILSYAGLSAHPIQCPFSGIPCADDATSSSPVAFPWMKPTDSITDNPLAVQALPFCAVSIPLNIHNKTTTTSVQIPGFTTEKWDDKSGSSFGRDGPYRNGSKNILQLDPLVGFNKLSVDSRDSLDYEHKEESGLVKCFKGLEFTDVKSAGNINLDTRFPSGFGHGVSSKDFDEGKADLRSSSFRLRGKPETLEIKTDVEKESTSGGFIWNASTALCLKESENHRTEVANITTVPKILGFALLDKPQISKHGLSSSSVPLRDKSEADGMKDNVRSDYSPINLSNNLELLVLENQPRVDNAESSMGPSGSMTYVKCDINLNYDVIACKDQTNPLEISYRSDELATTSFGPRAVVKVTSHIDLEALHVEDEIPEEGSLKTNQYVAPIETNDSLEILARTAAEAIVAISSPACRNLGEGGCCDPPGALRDSLFWFAEVVSSNSIDLKGMAGPSKRKVNMDQKSSDEGSDYFEIMTLKLTETNVEEYCSKSWEREPPKEEEAASSLLLTRPRRGHRRGRQRKDFRKDILPGLASLSRHEVTEDLQMLGGLMRASGCSWQMGLSRRNSRNGWSFSARGRRQMRGSNAASPPPSKRHTNVELEPEGISLQGWGKRTRRVRRQRYPAFNVAALLSMKLL